MYLESNQNGTPYERAALPLGHTPSRCRESGSDRRTSYSSGRRCYQLSYLGKGTPGGIRPALAEQAKHRVCRTRALTVELQVHRWPIRNSNPGQEIENLLSWSLRRMGRDQCRGLGLNFVSRAKRVCPCGRRSLEAVRLPFRHHGIFFSAESRS